MPGMGVVGTCNPSTDQAGRRIALRQPYKGYVADLVSTITPPHTPKVTEQTPLRLELEPELYYSAYIS